MRVIRGTNFQQLILCSQCLLSCSTWHYERFRLNVTCVCRLNLFGVVSLCLSDKLHIGRLYQMNMCPLVWYEEVCTCGWVYKCVCIVIQYIHWFIFSVFAPEWYMTSKENLNPPPPLDVDVQKSVIYFSKLTYNALKHKHVFPYLTLYILKHVYLIDNTLSNFVRSQTEPRWCPKNWCSLWKNSFKKWKLTRSSVLHINIANSQFAYLIVRLPNKYWFYYYRYRHSFYLPSFFSRHEHYRRNRRVLYACLLLFLCCTK